MEQAEERAYLSILKLLPWTWFQLVEPHQELKPEPLTLGLAGELLTKRFRNFGQITDGLDPHHVAAAIWAYSDDTTPNSTPGVLSPTHKVKFDAQKQKLIDAINFIDDVWGPLSSFYDIENLSSSVENLKHRADLKDSWAVPLTFLPR